MQDNFENVQVGDKLILQHSRRAPQVVEVGRLMKSQFELKGSTLKFWKKDGRRVGGSSAWSSTWVQLANEEEMVKVDNINRKNLKANNVRTLIDSANLTAMDEDSLDTILAVLRLEKERDNDR